MAKNAPAPKSKNLVRRVPRVILHWHEKRRGGVLVDYARIATHPDGAKHTITVSPKSLSQTLKQFEASGTPAGTYKYVCGQIDEHGETFRVFLRTDPVEWSKNG